ncbi:MAG TPA: hypothetical protein VGK50_02430 [Coriobacteriia bacterium]
MNTRRLRAAAAILIAAAVLYGCSAAPAADQPIKKPKNVSSGPETLLPAPTSAVEDTPSWTELPKPVADVFGTALDKGRFQAFAAMKQITIAVRLKSAVKERDVYRALDAASAFTPNEYSVLLNVYAPAADGKDRYAGYEWTPLTGTLVKKGSSNADQSWDSAITAITQGSVTDFMAPAVKRVAEGQDAPPLFR